MMKFVAALLILHLVAPVLGFSSVDPKDGLKTRASSKSSRLESTRDGDERWDPLRFVQQSSKFVSLPFQGSKQRIVRPGDVVWQAQAQNDFTMAPLDDVVMGGVSFSVFDDRTGRWTGTVTDANNGGFIGIRSTPSLQWDMSGCQGLEWKLNTDADQTRRYKFVVRDSADFNGITWTTSADVAAGAANPLLKLFPKKKGTTESSDDRAPSIVRVLFEKLIPTRFAQTVSDQTFRKENVVGVQVAFSKFEYDGDLNPNFALGDVDLQIVEIRAY